LGTVGLESDGSFFAEVPADVPLGLEALDAQGKVLRRLAPFFWVRPGEARVCAGCHERSNPSLKNPRPLAAGKPAVRLAGGGPAAPGRNP
jgi:hypothetical protein